MGTARAIITSILLFSAALPALPCDNEERGTAGWYGAPFAGRTTASGEAFDPDVFTAAHRTLPLGSELEVTEVDSGRSVRVTINDRGPYAHGRIIDLSRAAADALDMIEAGTADVRICVLSVPDGGATAASRPGAAAARPTGAAAASRAGTVAVPPATSGVNSGDSVALQVASFSNPENLERAAARLAAEELETKVVQHDGLHRLLVVDVASGRITQLVEELEELGFPGAFPVGNIPAPSR